MITQITDDMVGKKVTCKIYSGVVDDAKIQKQNDTYYICQNMQSGSNCDDKLGYKYSWSVDSGKESRMIDNNVNDLKLAEPTELPIFN